ncbi:MAG: fluoride efflux transporter CrcB [Chloroflexi bacterium]|nr:MAG: fluoride efflux transporter CrcB [Chloroflexota bacterium]MBL1197232.1 fluoride efflux transporter CrcB [Chloroflexota bacterium]NOH14526.1 fluoride efflux transporter CrcB [Chloroflexota bacterium]
MLQILWVGIGGFLGAVLRYGLVSIVHRSGEVVAFPYGILTANLIGSFLIGFLSVWGDGQEFLPAEARAFIFIGLLGSFTTFSTFANDSLNLLRVEQSNMAFANMALHLFLGLGAVWLGRVLAIRLF